MSLEKAQQLISAGEKALEVNPVNFDAQKRIDELARHLEFKREKKEDAKRGKTAFNIGVAAGVVGIFIFPAVFGLLAILCGVIAIALGNQRGTTVILLGLLDMVLFFVLLDNASSISFLF